MKTREQNGNKNKRKYKDLIGLSNGHNTGADLQFSNTTGILQKKQKTMWFIGVEVEQETSAPPPKKNPGSAPDLGTSLLVSRRYSLHSRFSFQASKRASA